MLFMVVVDSTARVDRVRGWSGDGKHKLRLSTSWAVFLHNSGRGDEELHLIRAYDKVYDDHELLSQRLTSGTANEATDIITAKNQ